MAVALCCVVLLIARPVGLSSAEYYFKYYMVAEIRDGWHYRLCRGCSTPIRLGQSFNFARTGVVKHAPKVPQYVLFIF